MCSSDLDLVAPGQSLAGDLVEAGTHAMQLVLGHRVKNFMAFHQGYRIWNLLN